MASERVYWSFGAITFIFMYFHIYCYNHFKRLVATTATYTNNKTKNKNYQQNLSKTTILFFTKAPHLLQSSLTFTTTHIYHSHHHNLHQPPPHLQQPHLPQWSLPHLPPPLQTQPPPTFPKLPLPKTDSHLKSFSVNILTEEGTEEGGFVDGCVDGSLSLVTLFDFWDYECLKTLNI